MAKISRTGSQATNSNIRSNNQCRDILPSRNVCRNLFGPIDHRELREEIQKDKRKQVEEQKKKYNFDFEKGQPLVGRYSWEPFTTLVDSSSSEKPLITTEKRWEENEVIESSAKNEQYKKVLKSETSTHRITNFFRVKKRKLEETSQEDDGIIGEHSRVTKNRTQFEAHVGNKECFITGNLAETKEGQTKIPKGEQGIIKHHPKMSPKQSRLKSD